MAYTPGNGSLLKCSISASFTTIVQQFSFGGLKRTRAQIDVTGLADTFEVSKPGLKRGDLLPFAGWYDPADTTHQYLESSFNSGNTESWKIVEADTGTAEIAFSGWLADLEWGETNVDGYVAIRGSIKLTTNATVTP